MTFCQFVFVGPQSTASCVCSVVNCGLLILVLFHLTVSFSLRHPFSMLHRDSPLHLLPICETLFPVFICLTDSHALRLCPSSAFLTHAFIHTHPHTFQSHNHSAGVNFREARTGWAHLVDAVVQAADADLRNVKLKTAAQAGVLWTGLLELVRLAETPPFGLPGGYLAPVVARLAGTTEALLRHPGKLERPEVARSCAETLRLVMAQPVYLEAMGEHAVHSAFIVLQGMTLPRKCLFEVSYIHKI